MKRGFTIIEVMIVLAIAGFILLMVFLAVPALQRNSRNNARRNDAAAIAASVTSFMDNHAIMPPDRIRNGSDITYVDIGSSTNLNDYESAKLGYYNAFGSYDGVFGKDADNIEIDQTQVTAPPVINPTVLPNNTGISYDKISSESVGIIIGETCNATGTGAGDQIDNAVAVFYVVETGGGLQLECID